MTGVAARAAGLLAVGLLAGPAEVSAQEMTALDVLEVCESSDLGEQTMCQVVFEGVVWGIRVARAERSGAPPICFPPDMNSDAFQAIFETFMQDHTLEQDKPFYRPLTAALAGRYPCPTPERGRDTGKE